MGNKKQITLSVELKGQEITIFEAAFKSSGFRTRAEYIRYLLRRETEPEKA